MKAVIFDVGNVLIDWDPKRVYREHFVDEAAIDAFFEEIGFHAWNLGVDRGGTWAEAVAAHSARHPEHAELIARYDRDWQRSVSGAIEGSVEILDALKAAGVPLFAITNFAEEKWAETVERFEFIANSFKDIVVSAHAGLVKPEPAIYELLLTRNGITAADCVFIDDSPINVAGAAAIGIDAILFREPTALATELRERGLPA